MALEGTIKDFGLADIFQLISLQKKTGTLTVESKGNAVNIYFHEGKIIYADVLKRWEGDKLGEVLLKTRMITKEQMERAIEINRESGHMIGHILVKENLISKEDLSEALQLQMKKLMFHLFLWKDGNYKFIPNKVSYNDDILIPINTEYILMEGMRLLDEWPSVEKRIPSFDIVFKKSEVDITPQLSEEDMKVFENVDGKSDIGMIIDSCGMGELEICNSLILLMDTGLIEQINVKGQFPVIEKEEEKEKGEEKILYRILVGAKQEWVRGLIIGLIILLFILFWGTRALKEIKKPIAGTVAVNRIEDLKMVIRSYYLDKGEYPASLESLVKENYKKHADILDPWGRIYIYQWNDGNYYIYSSGPDGIKGNEDDIK